MGRSDPSRVEADGESGWCRSVATCRQHRVPINSRCRQLAKTDFTEFDYIIGQ